MSNDLYNGLVTEILVSDLATKDWKAFEAKYASQVGRPDLFVQFTQYGDSTDDKRMVGAMTGGDTILQAAKNPAYQGSGVIRGPSAKARARAMPDMTLWTEPNHKDPAAIYTYPLSFVIENPATIPYGSHSRFLRVVKLRAGAKTLDLQSITTKQQALALLNQMGAIPPGADPDAFWADLEKYTKEKVVPQPLTTPKAFFQGAQAEFRTVAHPLRTYYAIDRVLSNTEQAKRFLKAGITVVIDRAKGREDAVIHPNEPTQAFFMRRDAFDILDVFEIGKKTAKDMDHSIWNHRRGTHQIMGRLVNAIDPKDKIVKVEQFYGGVESFSEPLKYSGVVNLGAPFVAVTKRGRAVAVDLKNTDRFIPDKPGEGENKHIGAAAKIEVWSEGGLVKHTIDNRQDLSAGLDTILKRARAAKPMAEWKPARIASAEPGEAWRKVLRQCNAVLNRGRDQIDIDKLLADAPIVCDNLKRLFATVGWHWDPPKGHEGGDWNLVACWMAATTFSVRAKKVNSMPRYKDGMERILGIRDKMKKGEESPTLNDTEARTLGNTKVEDAAICIMAGSCESSYIEAKGYLYRLLDAMEHIFAKRYIVMMSGFYANFDNPIDRGLEDLIEDCQPEKYEKHLRSFWEHAQGNSLPTTYFVDRTGENPKQEWKNKVNEVIIGNRFSLETPNSVGQGGAMPVVWKDPSKEASFSAPAKRGTANPVIARAKKAVETVIKRHLTWLRDPSTGSETAYIGHGRKVRVGLRNVTAGPKVITLRADKMPADLSGLLS